MRLKVSWQDAALGILLAGLMFLSVLLGAQQDAQANAPPALTSYSNEANGARALALWLEGLGYPVRRLQGLDFRLERDACLLFVLSPQQPYSSGELRQLDDWVTAGGVLVLATEATGVDPLLEHFELELGSLYDLVEETGPAQPLLLNPPWTQAQVRARRHLIAERDDVVVYVRATGRPLVLSFEHGAGQVFVTATTFPFSNAGLRDAGNARLVHNLAAAACTPADGAPLGNRGTVVFDEFHHGYQTARTLTTWLKTSAQGHSLLYAALVIFVYLVVGGRRLGRPSPLPQATTRRAPVEHIQAMANLFRRGGKRAAILRHYHDRLKRELAHTRRLDPTLSDGDFVAQLGALYPSLDQAALLKLLHETGQAQVSEGELIRLAKEVDDWTSQIS
jgi:hypothetical protein